MQRSGEPLQGIGITYPPDRHGRTTTVFETIVCSLASRGLGATCAESRQFVKVVTEGGFRVAAHGP